MRKILSVIILFGLMMTPLMAVSETLTLNALIPETIPMFEMQGSLTQNTGYTINSLNSPKDISVEDIEVFIKIVQTNRARVKGKYMLSLSATSLKMDNDNETELPSIVQMSKFTSVNDLSVDGDSTDLSLNYKTGKPIKPYYGQANAGEIALLKITYPAKDDLANGTYTSTITFTYTAI